MTWKGILKSELDGLPDESVLKVLEYVHFLKYTDQAGPAHPSMPRRLNRKFGTLADRFVSIAPDFDDTMEGLEEYL